MDRPEAKGGHNIGPMGGEALLASLGGCFMSNLRAAIAARDEVIVNDIALSITATVAPDSARFSAIHLQVAADADTSQLQKLVTIADRSCIAANTLRSALDLTVAVS
ncbi:MAG: osmotically inducible protein OsmC [Acidobacteria bacterium]|nr:osmotically inducible protein OsmC [Acidobacteriota bacterium]|tara:strand:+ start:537 stop:857 length:321 start_codon:yes stop_codon:yes gene_type:complete